MPQAHYTNEEARKAEALEALKRARQKALAADRAGELARAKELFRTSGVQSFIQGGEQGLLHGFADDLSRAMVDDNRLETLGDKIYADTGERVAVNQVLAKASDPTAYGLGEIAGAGLAGFVTRGLVKGTGLALKGKAAAQRASELGRAGMRVSEADRAREAAAANRRFAERATQADRVGNFFFPSNRAQAVAFDTAHGAAMGFGGLDPEQEEDAFSTERALRALLGGGIGFAFAPTMAAGANYGGQASKFLQQEAGLMPHTPLRMNQLKEGRTAEDVIGQMLGADEFAARGTREGGAGRMRGSEGNPLIYAEGKNTRGLVDAAIASFGGRGTVEAAVPGAPTGKQTRLVSRMAQAPGGGKIASDMAATVRDEGSASLGDFLRQVMAGKRETLSNMDKELLPALMKAYDRRDAAVSADWARARSRLTEAGRTDLRKRIFGRMLKAFNEDGADGVIALVNDPNVRPFLDQGGYRTQARQIEQFTNRNGKHRAITRLMGELQAALARDEKGAVPFFANPADQKAARYQMAPGPAEEIARASMPKSGFQTPRYVAPVDPATAPAIFEPTRPPLQAYMAEAGRSTRDKLFGRQDFSAGDVAYGGAAATAVAALAEDKLIGPLIRALMESGMAPEEILGAVDAQQGVPGGMSPGMYPQP